MNAASFIANFGDLANAPDGVKRVRELILQLAMSAKLTNQEESDINADELFERNQQHRELLIAAKTIRAQKSLPVISDEEVPWTLPGNWKWCRLGQITSYGSTQKAEPSDVSDETWVLELEDIEKETSRLLSRVRAQERKFRSTKNQFDVGNVLYGKLRPYLDKVLVADEPGVCTTEIIPILTYEGIIPEYLRWYLKSPFFVSYANGSTHGMNLPRLGTEPARAALFALPPLEEQKRIIAKVDELMSLCDKLEALQQERERRFPVLSKVSHTRLAERCGDTDLSLIFDQNTGVSCDDARKTVLRLAASGKLTKQDVSDEPATRLLQRLNDVRSSLLDSGYPNENEAKAQQKKQKKQRVPSGLPALPVGWQWATLMEASLLVVDCYNKTPPYVGKGIDLIRTTNVRHGTLNFKDPRFVTLETYEKWSARCKPEPGDILITREAPMGEVCIIPEGKTLCLGQRMMLIRPDPRFIDTKFMLYSLMDPDFMNRVQDKPVGMTVQHLRVGGVETVLMPIPPYKEQIEIVGKIERLMGLIDTLEQLGNRKHSVSAAFAKAVVFSITGSETKESENMKTPKTELISNLKFAKKPKASDKATLARHLTKAEDGKLSAKALWQKSGLEIDAFYQQLRTEIAAGWIAEPESKDAYMKEISNK